MKSPYVAFLLFQPSRWTQSPISSSRWAADKHNDHHHQDGPYQGNDILPLQILYESDQLAVVAKPALVPCHWPEIRDPTTKKRSIRRPQHPHQSSSSSSSSSLGDGDNDSDEYTIPVLQRAIATFPNQPTIRLVHRLDAATSGCLLLAFSSDVARVLQQHWHEQYIEKTYYAICRGDGESLRIRGKFVANGPVKDSKGILRDSETEIEGLWGSNGLPRRCCLVQAKPKTGRWHQIRQHLGRENYPIVSEKRHHPDKRENKAWKEDFWDKHDMPQRLCLHCHRIEINEPIPNILPTGLNVSCPLPIDMQTIIDDTDWKLDARNGLPELFS